MRLVSYQSKPSVHLTIKSHAGIPPRIYTGAPWLLGIGKLNAEEAIMKTYQVTVFKSESVIYSIEASSESEARAKLGEGTEKLLKSCPHDFDITYIDEVA